MERISNFRSKRNKLRVLWKSRELGFLFPLAACCRFYGVYSVHNPGAEVPLSSRSTPLIIVSLPRPSSTSYGIYVDDKNEFRLGAVTVVLGDVVGLQVAADDPKGRESILLTLTGHLIDRAASGRQSFLHAYVAKCSERLKYPARTNTRTLKQILSLSKTKLQAIAQEPSGS